MEWCFTFENTQTRPKSTRQAHKKFRIALIHELVQPLLDDRSQDYISAGRPALSQNENRLKGKHFATSKYPHEKKCCVVCGYKKNAKGKTSYKKTWNFCARCNKFICKLCFEKYHTQSNLK